MDNDWCIVRLQHDIVRVHVIMNNAQSVKMFDATFDIRTNGYTKRMVGVAESLCKSGVVLDETETRDSVVVSDAPKVLGDIGVRIFLQQCTSQGGPDPGARRLGLALPEAYHNYPPLRQARCQAPRPFQDSRGRRKTASRPSS